MVSPFFIRIRRLSFVFLLVVLFSGVAFWLRNTERHDEPRVPPGIADQAGAVEKASDPFDPASRTIVSPGWWRVEPALDVGTTANVIRPAHDVPSYADRVLRAFPVAVEVPVAAGSMGGGTRLALPLPGGMGVEGVINLLQRELDGRVMVGGRLDDGGTFSLTRLVNGNVVGRILPDSKPGLAYVLAEGRDGRVYLLEKERDTVICTEMRVVGNGVQDTHDHDSAHDHSHAHAHGAEEATLARAAASDEAGKTEPQEAPPAGLPVPQSQVAAVIFLDFDGETVTDPDWNGGATFTVANSGLTSTQMTSVVRLVQEDYRPFNIEVTTDPERYAAAPVRKRMRCIITTSTHWWSGTGGGVAYPNSWNTAGYSFSSTVPCWAISSRLGMSSKSIADAVSHEVGHTLGLSHDGLVGGTDNYYDGNETETPSWGPLMGNSYSVTLSQWSKGEYVKNGVAASNTEDDLRIIASIKNHAGYKDDDVSSVSTSAMALLAAGAVTVNKSGIIERSGDIDAYMFATSGAVNFTLATATWLREPNLDAKLTIKDFAGNTLAEDDPQDSIYPSISTTLPAGVYVLQITGAGKGTGTTDGYTNYGSVGAYRITGSVGVTSAFTPRIGGWLNTSGQVGVPFTYSIQSAGNPTTYAVATSLPAGLSLNATTGVISGTPTEEGSFSIALRATNAAGTASRTVWFNILPDNYAAAVDAPSLNFSSGGSEVWEIVDDDAQVGRVSVRAGQITNGGTSWIETTTPGAGVLTFWWKTSSETGADYLRYRVGGDSFLTRSGATEWEQVTRTLTGARTIRWSYEKNATTSSNSDTAWVDGITFTMAPAINSATVARGVVGQAFTYAITSTQTVDSYAASGLPAGLSVNPATGEISGTPTMAGTYAITLETTNVAGSRTATLTLSVLSPFAAWSELHGVLSPDSDTDGDGRSALMEYAMGSNPAVVDAEPPARVAMVDTGAIRELEIEFFIPTERPGVRYGVEVSTDLISWQQGHAYGTGVINGPGLPTTQQDYTALPDNGGTRVKVRTALPEDGASSRTFLRLRVELAAE